MDAGGDEHPLGLVLQGAPWPPAQQPVDRVARRRLGQGELALDAVEAVAPVGQAVRPGREHGPVGAVAEIADVVGLEHGTLAVEVLPDPAADLDDRRPLAARCQLELLA